jgi:hypothetical protein
MQTTKTMNIQNNLTVNSMNKTIVDIDDEESTVSYFENPAVYMIEMNHEEIEDHPHELRWSFDSWTTDDESVDSTVASTCEDDGSSSGSVDFSHFFSDETIDRSVDDEDLNNETEYNTSNLQLPLEANNLQLPLEANNSRNPKRVRFGMISIREYGVTVSSYTTTTAGTCPIELTWEHSEFDSQMSFDDAGNIQRQLRHNVVLRPLSVQERRDRIARVQGISVENVAILECEASLWLIQDTIISLEKARQKILNGIESPSFKTRCAYPVKKIVGEANDIFRRIMLKEIPPIYL